MPNKDLMITKTEIYHFNMIGTTAIVDRISMTALLEKYGIYPTRQKVYNCPFHNDINPSASVHKDKWFHCFACGINYNVVDFVAKYENCSRNVAVQKIKEMFSLGFDEEEWQRIAAKLRHKLEIKNAEKRDRHIAIIRVIDEIRLWESVQKDCHPTRGEIRKDKWSKEKLYFYALKQQAFLSWLYDRLSEHYIPESEYYDLYPYTTKELTNKILNEVGFLTP